MERYGAGESSIKHDIIELRKQGYEIPGGGKKGYRLIASLTEDTDQPVYCESLRQDNPAKLLVLLILQREGKPMNPAEIADNSVSAMSERDLLLRGRICSMIEEEKMRNWVILCMLNSGFMMKSGFPTGSAGNWEIGQRGIYGGKMHITFTKMM